MAAGFAPVAEPTAVELQAVLATAVAEANDVVSADPVSYTHLRAHETVLDLVCRLLLEKKKHKPT